MKSNNGCYMKRRDFLSCVEKTYEDATTDHLIALRDALSIIISNRVGNYKYKDFKYEGYVKYV